MESPLAASKAAASTELQATVTASSASEDPSGNGRPWMGTGSCAVKSREAEEAKLLGSCFFDGQKDKWRVVPMLLGH